MQIEYQDKILLDSQTFIVLGTGVTKVKLGEGTEMLTFHLDFAKTDDKKQNIHFEGIDQRSLKIVFENWESMLPATFTKPLPIGTFNKRTLYLIISIQKIGVEGDFKLVTVTFYLGEEAASV